MRIVFALMRAYSARVEIVGVAVVARLLRGRRAVVVLRDETGGCRRVVGRRRRRSGGCGKKHARRRLAGVARVAVYATDVIVVAADGIAVKLLCVHARAWRLVSAAIARVGSVMRGSRGSRIFIEQRRGLLGGAPRKLHAWRARAAAGEVAAVGIVVVACVIIVAICSAARAEGGALARPAAGGEEDADEN